MAADISPLAGDDGLYFGVASSCLKLSDDRHPAELIFAN